MARHYAAHGSQDLAARQKEGIGCSGCGSQGELTSLSRDLPVVVGVAVSPNFRSDGARGAPAVAQPRDMHVSLSLLLVSAPWGPCIGAAVRWSAVPDAQLTLTAVQSSQPVRQWPVFLLTRQQY